MSVFLHPFTGLIPASEFARRVVGPPALTLSVDQRDAARLDPLSFRYSVGRGVGTSHSKGVAWLSECQDRGALRPAGPAILVYRQSDANGSATGIVADVSLRAYDDGLIKRHEKTVGKTRRKMEKYIRSTRIYGNPVALAHEPHYAVDATIAAHVERAPDAGFSTTDGVEHQLWIVGGSEAIEVCASFDTGLYITDGHHRLAAASAVAAEEGRSDAYFPAGLFATSQLRLRSFARCVDDPGLDAGSIIDRLQSEHRMKEVKKSKARPRRRHEFGVKIRGHHFRLRLGGQLPDAEMLDVDLLQERILGPVFGITDPSTDKRLRFVADIPERSEPVPDADAWLLPFPIEVDDVMAVADSGRVMPPKSTWFAPKMPSGLAIRTVDEVTLA
ncbi:MAG: DUF1015 domain-containing protein [bacterium]|nr:DUF1015 domain-containing protein [bacterium]